MKTPRIFILFVAALCCVMPLQSSPAADVVVDISSFAPREPEVVIRQIELNVAIKQYEKVLMEKYEARMQRETGPTEPGLTDAQMKEWYLRADKKLKYLEETASILRKRIHDYVAEANEMAREMERQKAKENAKATLNGPAAERRG